MVVCSQCGKNIAVCFPASADGKGLCLICAKERNLPLAAAEIVCGDRTDDETGQMPAEVPVPQPVQTEKAEICSFCQKRQPVICSNKREYGLCRECAWLLYPQIDIHQAEADGLSVEAACARAVPQNPCGICGIRDAQVHTFDGEFCIVCAKRNGMPEADKFARRMGIAAEALDAFVQKVDAAEQQAHTAKTDAPTVPQNDAPRFRLLDTFAVGDRNILIVADRETGVQYMTNEQFSGFSPLLDADGKPLIARF